MIKRILVMQFVLELQRILRLAFSPMQLDFESENPIGLSLPYFPVNGQLYPTVSPHFTQ